MWIYEGRNNGWWYYDYDVQIVIETAWKENKNLDWYMCGQMFHLDFTNMRQVNTTNNAIRSIKRVDHEEINSGKLLVKGVSGMRSDQ